MQPIHRRVSELLVDMQEIESNEFLDQEVKDAFKVGRARAYVHVRSGRHFVLLYGGRVEINIVPTKSHTNAAEAGTEAVPDSQGPGPA